MDVVARVFREDDCTNENTVALEAERLEVAPVHSLFEFRLRPFCNTVLVIRNYLNHQAVSTLTAIVTSSSDAEELFVTMKPIFLLEDVASISMGVPSANSFTVELTL